MKKKSSVLLALTLSATACFAAFPACSSDGLAEELITALQNEEQIVATSYDMRFDMKATVDEKTQSMSLTMTGVENAEKGEADFFLTGVTKDGEKTETVFQDTFVRAGVVLSTDTYGQEEDGKTQVLTVGGSVEETLNEAMGGLLTSDISLEGLYEELLLSFLQFAEEYDGLNKEWGVYVLDFNKLVYNVARDMLPVVKGLNEKTTVGEVLEKRQIKRFVDACAQDKTMNEFYEGFGEFGDLLKAFLGPVKSEDEEKSVYDYLVGLTKTENFMASATDGDTLLYDATVNEVLLNLYNVSVKDFVDDTRELIEDNIKKDGLTISLDYLSEGAELCINDVVIKYVLDGEQIKSQEATVEIAIEMEGERLEMDLALSTEALDKAQELTNLYSRQVNVTENVWDTGEESGFGEICIAPEVKETVCVNVRGDEIEVYFKKLDGNVDVNTIYDQKNDVYRYTLNGNSMYVKLLRLDEYHMGVNIYRANGELFNSDTLPISSYEKDVTVSYAEFLARGEDDSYVVAEGLKFKYLAETDSYSVKGFSRETVIRDLVIPSSVNGKPVTEIGVYAFQYEQELVSVVIPDSVQIVRAHAFYECPYLTTAEVHAKILETYAFQGCYALETVQLNGVSIFNDAFRSGCYNVKEISCGSGLFSIDSYVFYAMDIKTFTYDGTVAEWLAIRKGDWWSYGVNCNVTCSDGVVDVNGNVVEE